MTAFMDGYRAALEDMDQALQDVPCRCLDTHTRDRCLIYRADMAAVVQGALRGCPCEPP